ncbi:hypothetical protein O3P69_015439 [Scylla paramamosain]|uniref:Uncharacterized protein n=1 Tax=Scylla paramamosain TaxID=85552 RepID=A0AAW0T6L3_SCYPA
MSVRLTHSGLPVAERGGKTVPRTRKLPSPRKQRPWQLPRHRERLRTKETVLQSGALGDSSSEGHHHHRMHYSRPGLLEARCATGVVMRIGSGRDLGRLP